MRVPVSVFNRQEAGVHGARGGEGALLRLGHGLPTKAEL